MTAVFKHELRMYFQSLTAYVFGAFLLVIVGIGAMLYNLQAAVSNFEYVLSFASIIYAIIVPILTMRVIAEERRQKTDQLLYSLPISTLQVILGKYLALLTVFAIPLCIISVYPVIFAQYGDVYLPTSYGSIIAFFLMGGGTDCRGCLHFLPDGQPGLCGRRLRGSDSVQLFQRHAVGVCLLHRQRVRPDSVCAGCRSRTADSLSDTQ